MSQMLFRTQTLNYLTKDKNNENVKKKAQKIKSKNPERNRKRVLLNLNKKRRVMNKVIGIDCVSNYITYLCIRICLPSLHPLITLQFYPVTSLPLRSWAARSQRSSKCKRHLVRIIQSTPIMSQLSMRKELR